MYKQPNHTKITVAITGALALMSGSVAMAASLTVTNTFTSGQPATAASVNQNFTDVKTAVDDNDSRITTNTTNIGSNTTSIGTNTTNIGTNTTDIGNNASNIATNAGDVSNNSSLIADHETRITTLEGAGGGATTASPVAIDCSSAGPTDITDAIDTAAPHGRLVVTLTGTCSENVVVNRNQVTLTGGTLQGAVNTAPVIDVARRGLRVENIAITGGSYGVYAKNGATVILTGATISGPVVDPASGLIPSGVGVFANAGSAVVLSSGNTITGGSDGNALFGLANSSIRWVGGNNSINAGTLGSALGLSHSSSLLQEKATTGNQINGEIEVSEGSNMFMQQVAITSDAIDAFGSSSFSLQPTTANGITVTMGAGAVIEAGNGSTIDIADEGVPVVVNAGAGSLMRLLDHSTLLLWSGSTLNMNVEMFRSSSIDGGDSSTINGNLDVNGFSTIAFDNQVSSPVTGTTTCGNAEAFWFDTVSTFTDLCI